MKEWDIITLHVTKSYIDIETLQQVEITRHFNVYIADTLDKIQEAYTREDTDFKNTSGILLLIYKYYKDTYCILKKKLDLTVIIGNLDVYIREKPVWKPGEQRYIVEQAKIQIQHTIQLQQGEEICISLKNMWKPIILLIDPTLYHELQSTLSETPRTLYITNKDKLLIYEKGDN